MFIQSIVMLPSKSGICLPNVLQKVDLPDPLSPIIKIFYPFKIVRFKEVRNG